MQTVWRKQPKKWRKKDHYVERHWNTSRNIGLEDRLRAEVHHVVRTYAADIAV